MLRLMDGASVPPARLAAVYRASVHLHRDVTAGVRRQLLALDAARYGDRELAARITAVSVKGEPAAQWGVEWATGTAVEHRYRHVVLPGHTGDVESMATTVVGGSAVAVTGSRDDETVRVWDLVTGQPVGEHLTGLAQGVRALAMAVVDGRPVAVIASNDETEGTVRVWDLATGRQIGEPLDSDHGWMTAVATMVVGDGSSRAITCDSDGRVGEWDLATGSQVGELDSLTLWTCAVATVVVDSCSHAVAGGLGGLAWVWDLATGQIGESLIGHTGDVCAVGTALVGGRPVAVTGSDDATVRMWDLTTGQQIGEPLTGHTGTVLTMATGVVEGRSVAVTGGADRQVRVWDLATGRPIGRDLVFPAPVNAVAVAPDGRLVVGFGHEVAVLARR
ncbi:WD40 repeat domain-containing protein [Streptomyces sp. NPDC001890]|uniref:WD40 repeat domain-containing protein n=1 Tax=Streptomyces sp. NPDC001890 TaxID=3364620 RepID=UPI0036D06156